MDLACLPANPWLLFVCLLGFVFLLSFFLCLFCFGFFDVAGFFLCLVLTDYVVYSVLIEHVQRFEPQVGCSKRDSAL